MRSLYILIFLIGLTGCARDEVIMNDCNCTTNMHKTCVVYEITYCADPWGYDANQDGQPIITLKRYFEALGVELHEVHIDENGTPQFCYACHCKSGQRFCAKVRNEDLTLVKEHGFVEN